LKSRALLISKSLAVIDNQTRDSVGQVMSILETDGLSHILVTDAEGDPVFEASVYSENKDITEWGVDQALGGFDAFYSVLSDGAFTSSAAIPIISGDTISGAVFISERDAEQGEIILSLQRNIIRLSVMMSVIIIALGVLFSGTITRRITLVLNAIKSVREGEYGYRVEVSGNDELTQLGEEFNSLTSRLQVTEETRRRFVSDASHELKTPLASIKLLSDSILQNETMDSATVREFVGDIGTEAERLARTTEKLLSLTRIDSAVNTTRRVPVDMGRVITGAVRILRQLASENSVTLHSDLQDGCTVLATDDDIYQIALNLIENAIKYNSWGGSVFIRLARVFDSVELTVEDTGIGIPEDDLPHIFDRFYRVDKARSREAGGSGLGLSIVKSTAREHGGDVRAERRSEGGMRFAVVFPYYDAEKSEGSEREARD